MLRGQRIRIGGGDLDVLGGDAVGQRRRLVERAQHDHGAERLPSSRRRCCRAAVAASWRSHGRCDRSAEGRIVGHQDGLGGGVVLGLGQQVGREPLRIVVRSAITSTSEGPAMESMPTVPNTCRLAAAT